MMALGEFLRWDTLTFKELLGHFLLQLSRYVVFKTHNHLGDVNVEKKADGFDVAQESVDMLTMW